MRHTASIFSFVWKQCWNQHSRARQFIVSLAAVFWMSRNAPPKEGLLTSELHSFLIVLVVCLRSIEQTNHIPEI